MTHDCSGQGNIEASVHVPNPSDAEQARPDARWLQNAFCIKNTKSTDGKCMLRPLLEGGIEPICLFRTNRHSDKCQQGMLVNHTTRARRP